MPLLGPYELNGQLLLVESNDAGESPIGEKSTMPDITKGISVWPYPGCDDSHHRLCIALQDLSDWDTYFKLLTC